MNFRNLAVGVGVTAALAVAATGVTAANASTPVTISSAPTAVADKQPAAMYTTRDVISFFVLRTGAIFENHAELASQLNLKHQSVPASVIDQAVSLFTQADPEFESRVTEALQAGDSERAQNAVAQLAKDAKSVNDSIARTPGQNGDARGAVKTNTVLYTQSVGATVQVVGAAAVGLVLAVVAAAAVFLALYAHQNGKTEFERELSARAIATSL